MKYVLIGGFNDGNVVELNREPPSHIVVKIPATLQILNEDNTAPDVFKTEVYKPFEIWGPNRRHMALAHYDLEPDQAIAHLIESHAKRKQS